MGVAIKIPPRVKRYLGLSDERSWVVLNEVFTGPTLDLRPIKARTVARTTASRHLDPSTQLIPRIQKEDDVVSDAA